MKSVIYLALLLLLSCQSKNSRKTTALSKESQFSASLMMNIHEVPRFNGDKKTRIIINQSYGRPVLALTIEKYDMGYLFCEKVSSTQEDIQEYHERCKFVEQGEESYNVLNFVENADYSKLNFVEDYGDATGLYVSLVIEGKFSEFSLSYCDNLDMAHSLIEPLKSMITLFEMPSC